MADEFNLPGSSFEELQKIIKGYSNAAENSDLEAISKLTGVHKTSVSRNNKFLSDIGIISGGLKKSATALGNSLGRALEHSQQDDVQKYWKEAVQTNEKMSGLVTTVRIRGGMSEKQFGEHVLYVSGQKNTSSNKTGARCVTDVLIAGSMLQEIDGKLSVATPVKDDELESPAKPDISAEPTNPEPTPVQAPSVDTPEALIYPNFSGIPQIAINIQLQLPETENPEVYDNLFRSLKEHLFPNKE